MATMSSKPAAEQSKQFLKTGLAMMNSKATRDTLMDPAIKQPGQHLKELQRAGWDAMGIDADTGCKALDQIDPSDEELSPLKMEFLFTSMKVYLQALEDRRPRELENTKKMPRALLIEFFDACNVKMQFPDFQQVLAEHVAEHRTPPSQLIIDAQRAMLETLGFEADHGCSQLSKVPEEYSKDPEMVQRFQQWAQVATNTGQTITSKVIMSSMPEKTVKRVQEAREAVAKMSEQEKEDLVLRMGPKFQTLSKLPANEQEAYMEKQPEEMQSELVRTQLILHSMRMMQMREQHLQSQAQGGVAAMPGSTASKPSQQQMM